MNTYSRRRRTFLSLVLSVAMVLSYSTAFLGTNVENVYAETSLISVDTWNADDEGVLHYEYEEGYVQEESWLRVLYNANVGMDPLGNYVDFKLETPEGFDCDFNSYSDSVLEEGERSGVTIWPPAGLPIGEYSGITLKVYEDATGQANFDYESDPAATFDIVLDIVPRKPFFISPTFWSSEINLEALEGLAPEEGAGEFDLYISNFDDAFTGEPVSSHIKFEFVGDEVFNIDGLEGLTFDSPEAEGERATLSVNPKQDLEVGYYNATLNVYIDNTGEQNFADTPVESIPVYLTVYERSEYDFALKVDNYGSFAALPVNYTSADIADNTATVTVQNTGKNDLTIDPSELIVAIQEDGESIKSDDFTIGFLKDAPFVLEPGESADLATVAPSVGLETGLHKADLDLAVECDGMWRSYSCPLEVYILKDAASLVYQDGLVDFGAELPGFGEDDYYSRCVTLVNDGNVPLTITSVTKPEEGPFAEITGYGWYIPGGATADLDVSLDASSAYAEQLGTYEGNYLVKAQECDETGEIVEDGISIQVEIPVKVEVTDILPAHFESNWNNGPSGEAPCIRAEEGYDLSEGSQTVVFTGTYGSHFNGKEVGDFVQFKVADGSAGILRIAEYEETAVLRELDFEDWYYQEVTVALVEGLEPDSYQAELNMYVDPKGTGNFDWDNPTEVIPFEIEVYEGRQFEILPEEDDEFKFVLPQGYSNQVAADSTQGVVVRNRSKSDLVIEKDNLKIEEGFENGQPEAFNLSYEDIEFPVTIAPGESKKIASVAPASGLDAGEYEAAISLDVGEAAEANDLSLVVTKNEPSIKWEDESVDFGYLQPGFSYEEGMDKGVFVSVINNGNTALRITDWGVPTESPFRVEMGSGIYEVDSGKRFSVMIMPDAYSNAAYQKGIYDETITITAQEIDENGELVAGGKTVQAELPVHLEITDETYTVTVDMQGHGENIELTGILKGTLIDDALDEVYGPSGEERPTAEGFVFEGFNGKPVSAYTSWEQYYMDDEGSLHKPLVENAAVYAIWLTEYAGSVELTIDAPKCGTSAETTVPQISVPEGAKYEVGDMHWLADSDEWEEYSGEFVGGEEYLVFARVTPKFPYGFPASGVQVTINGVNYDTSQSGHGDSGNSFGLWPPVVVKAEHNLIKTEAVEPTCEGNGNIEYWTCKGCGKMFSDADGSNEIQQADTVVGKTGHALTKMEEVSATCTAEGTEAYWTCTNCGKLFSDEEGTSEIEKPAAIAALGHDMEKTDKVEATCTAEGAEAYWTCTNCSKLFADEEGTSEIEKPVAIAALGHEMEKTDRVEPTCSAEGAEAYWTCSRCEKMFSDADGINEISNPVAIAKLEHSWNDGEVTAEPTCTEAGVKTLTCTVCGETKTEEVKATGHDLAKTEEVPATCTTKGREAYWTCSKCNKMFSDADGKTEISEPAEIEMVDHDYDDGTVTVEPTCTQAGQKIVTCKVCNGIKTVEVPAKGHTWDKGTVTTEPTCTETGVRTRTCTVCGETKTETEAAKGHTWGSWKVTKEATTTAAGEQVRECSVCHETEKQVIPKKEEPKYSDGWHKIGGYWYYYKNSVPVKNSWMKDSKGWCYLGSDGRMVTNGWAKDSHGWCWIGANGYMVEQTKWIKVDGNWYHITKGYRDQSKWMKDSKGWCYLGSDGKMVTNGWAKDSKGWCWMGSNGYWVANKWVKDKGEWYYIKSNHYMAANEWAKDSGGWMYMAASGKITKSKWVKSGGYWYYLKDNGYMATGTLKIGSKTYKFDGSGRWVQ